MDLTVIIGLLVSLVSIVVAFLMEGGHLVALIGFSAFLIVFGGTIGAVVISFPAKQLKTIGAAFKIVFKGNNSNFIDVVNYLKGLSVNSRKNGILSLEQEVNGDNDILDNFGKKTLELVIDGTEPDVVRSIMETNIEATDERHRRTASIFEAAGGYAPTMGIIGTVTGLVHVLGNLDDPSSLGPKIALAFIATLYGIGSANLIWLPIANKLKVINDIEIGEKTMILEGILLIQEGTNPNALVKRLESFMTSEELSQIEDTKSGE